MHLIDRTFLTRLKTFPLCSTGWRLTAVVEVFWIQFFCKIHFVLFWIVSFWRAAVLLGISFCRCIRFSRHINQTSVSFPGPVCYSISLCCSPLLWAHSLEIVLKETHDGPQLFWQRYTWRFLSVWLSRLESATVHQLCCLAVNAECGASSHGSQKPDGLPGRLPWSRHIIWGCPSC